jgi:hypothetical protein
MSDSENDIDTPPPEDDFEEEKPVKKRPGRPKKQVAKKPIKRLGVVDEPSNNGLEQDPRMNYVVELWYDNPAMFKRIFTLFKQLSVESIRILWDSDTLFMYATDHVGKNKIRIRIFGKQMSRYYCSKPLEVGLCPTIFQKILQTLRKEYTKISLASRKLYEKTRIRVILVNDEMEEHAEYDLDVNEVTPYDWAINEEIAREDYYPIKFEVPSRYFKGKVGDFKNLSDAIRIEKDPDSPLRFSYNCTNKRGSCNTYLKNPGKINLRCTLDPEDSFSTAVYVDHIKSLSATLIADSIHISADMNNNLIFTFLLDQEEGPDKKRIPGTEKCEIKIVTEIIKKEMDD